MKKLVYNQVYNDENDLIVDFILDVINDEGIEEGFTTDWDLSKNNMIKIFTYDGNEYMIEFVSWDDEDIIIMEYDFFISKPHGWVKITKDS